MHPDLIEPEDKNKKKIRLSEIPVANQSSVESVNDAAPSVMRSMSSEEHSSDVLERPSPSKPTEISDSSPAKKSTVKTNFIKSAFQKVHSYHGENFSFNAF